MKALVRGFCALVALLAVPSCAKSPTSPASSSTPNARSPVEYLVTGSATRASVSYISLAEGTAPASERTLPWSASFTANKGDLLYVSAQNAGPPSCVSVEIRVRGEYYRSAQACGLSVSATASGFLE